MTGSSFLERVVYDTHFKKQQHFCRKTWVLKYQTRANSETRVCLSLGGGLCARRGGAFLARAAATVHRAGASGSERAGTRSRGGGSEPWRIRSPSVEDLLRSPAGWYQVECDVWICWWTLGVHVTGERVACRCGFGAGCPWLGWLLRQFDVFLPSTVSLVRGLACTYCLHGDSLCFSIRDQTLVSNIINLPWTLNEIKGF